MTHPKPDRSDYRPNFKKTAQDDHLDIGWNEGFLSDGRPYRIECWTQDQITNVTVFLSTEGLENASNEQLADLLQRERVVGFKPGVEPSAYAMPLTDAGGNSLWSINIVIGVDDEPARADSVPLRPYSRPVA